MKKIFVLLLLLIGQGVFGQNNGALFKYRNDLKGDFGWNQEGILDGNQIRTYFRNDGQISEWGDGFISSCMEWPKGSGHNYVDGVALLVGSKISTAMGSIPTIATAYREHMDYDEQNRKIRWGFESIPGYMKSGSETPALSTMKNSWPDKWPRAIPEMDDTWDGYWYGYFGKGVKNADLETFFVMDDAQDKEFYRAPYNYRPLLSDPSRGGMGLRVEVRGFQWSHVLAEDIIFWHYDIINISDKDLDTTFFGFYSDIGVGSYDQQGGSYNNAYYNKELDITYGWDSVGTHIVDKKKLGYVGYAYLESPGNSLNGIDDDQDELFDESRENEAGAYTFGPVGKYDAPKMHWSGDEDGDWISFVDLNSNGEWDADENEPLNSDVGTDGIGPFDEGYVSPDADGTEGNGQPDQGEPNFGKTDKDESDQIGLTAVSLYVLVQGGVGGGWPREDPDMYDKMASGKFDTRVQYNNIQMVFSSGPFPLKVGKRERFSMALVMGDNITDLVFNKETVQQIYNANYNFSKPPNKPTLTAVPGDGKVFLYWNKVAESSRDPFLGLDPDSLGYKKDFEGYLLYRSTESQFNEVKTITDMNGDAKYWKPIARFDLIDSISGPDPVGINGASFNRGSNSGIQNSYIDTDVKNGMTYYYALCAYDKGDPKFGTKGLQPTENTKIITENAAGVITFIDQNCAVVVPNAPVAGYQAPYVRDVNLNGGGTGQVNVSILNPSEISDNVKYELHFHSTGLITTSESLAKKLAPQFKTVSYDVVKINGTEIDTIARGIDSTSFGAGKTGDPFDGMAVTVLQDTRQIIVDSLTGWTIGQSNLSMKITGSGTVGTYDRNTWPGDYEINFTSEKNQPSFGTTPPYNTGAMKVNFTIKNTMTGEQLVPFVTDKNGSKTFDVGDEFAIVEFEDVNNNGSKESGERRYTWKIAYMRADTNSPAFEPVAGDQFVIKTTKPFYEGDVISFVSKASSVDNGLANSQLKKIGVVPNPYIAAAKWEKKSIYSTGRGERKIDFINLPSSCTIRIYTVSGSLVKTIVKESSPTDGAVSWNLVSDDGMDIAYGLYVYHVDAPGIGEHIGKFAVIK